MKFTTPIITLVAASTIYAYNITSVFSNLSKRGNTLSKCESEVVAVEECFTSPTFDTQESACPKYHSEKCQQFYSDPFKFTPNCKDNKHFVKYFQPVVINNVKLLNYLSCQKDEVGNLCPYGEILLKETSKTLTPLTDEQRIELKKNTCQSKICRELTYEAFIDIESAKKAINELLPPTNNDDGIYIGKIEAARYMETEECKAMSGAFTLKIGTGFFISIGLLLLSLY